MASGAADARFAGRVEAVDVLRGAAVAGMLFVNDPGDWEHVWGPFRHAEWHGCTLADLVFPTFLFVVGLSAVFSIERRRDAGGSLGALAWQAFRRGAILALLGWALALFPFGLVRWLRGDFDRDPEGSIHGWWAHLRTLVEYLRIPGVLPRIGVVSILGAWILLGVRRADSRALVVALLLGLHTHLLLGLGLPLDPDENVQKWVDDSLLAGHLATREDTDPEGIVSTLSALATLLLGALAGMALRAERPSRWKSRTLLAAGAAGVVAGAALSPWIPINKKLWTPSFALLTAGLASAALAGAVAAASAPRLARGLAPLRTLGRNPLAAFLISGALSALLAQVRAPWGDGRDSAHAFLYRQLSWIGDPTLRSHADAFLFALAIFGILRWFERRGWAWKV